MDASALSNLQINRQLAAFVRSLLIGNTTSLPFMMANHGRAHREHGGN
jgi:hypothetical protein